VSAQIALSLRMLIRKAGMWAEVQKMTEPPPPKKQHVSVRPTHHEHFRDYIALPVLGGMSMAPALSGEVRRRVRDQFRLRLERGYIPA